MRPLTIFLFTYYSICSSCDAQDVSITDRVAHHFADNNGVKIHYVTMGEGQLVLFVHGFPDYWYTWRDQMEVLSASYKVAAVDLRGYNKSDGPEGVEYYLFPNLVSDIKAVIDDTGEKSAFLVGHDWGAAISWRMGMWYPEMIDKLIVISVPHPNAGDKVVAKPSDGKPSYADRFVSTEFRAQLTENWFSGWVTDQDAQEYYVEAFRRSDKDAMINYYRANFPTLENLTSEEFLNRPKDYPNLKMPVMIVHGEKDVYLPINGHNNTWNFVDNELTIEILPEAAHFVQQDESEKLTSLIGKFLIK